MVKKYSLCYFWLSTKYEMIRIYWTKIKVIKISRYLFYSQVELLPKYLYNQCQKQKKKNSKSQDKICIIQEFINKNKRR